MSDATPIKRNRMDGGTHARVVAWMTENKDAIPNLTVKEILALINAKVDVSHPICEKNVRTTLKHLVMACKSAAPADERVSRQGIYDKMLLLQGRIERQDEEINHLIEQLRVLTRDVEFLSKTWAPDVHCTPYFNN